MMIMKLNQKDYDIRFFNILEHFKTLMYEVLLLSY